jgi:hypothetical protein
MGQASKMKRARRASAAGQARRMQELDDQARARPDLIAEQARAAADTGLHLLIDAMLPAQRARLEAGKWRCVIEGADGLGMWEHHRQRLRVVHNVSREPDGHLWGHVSVSTGEGDMPNWYLVRDAHRLIYPDHPGLIVVAPESSHVNLSEVAHTWTRLTGGDPIPDFARFGVI